MTNEQLVTLFVQQYGSIRTQKTYRQSIRIFTEFVGNKNYASVTVEDASNYRANLTGKPSTQFGRWVGINSFYRWLVVAGYITRSPFAAVRGPKQTRNRTPRIPSDEQIHALISALSVASERDRRDRAIFALCANGFRVAEVASTDWQNVMDDDAGPVVRITGKGDKERLVPLSPFAVTALDDWRKSLEAAGKPVTGPLFTDYASDKRITTRQVQVAFDRIAKAAQVEGLSPHKLRHHYATRLIRAGADLFSVQKLLGHESIASTQIYVHLDMADLRKAVAKDVL